MRGAAEPLVVLEAIRCDYPWASDRFHAFAIDGMAGNAAAFAKAGVRHHPHVEPSRGAGKGLLEALAQRAWVVVTDDFPAFIHPCAWNRSTRAAVCSNCSQFQAARFNDSKSMLKSSVDFQVLSPKS